MTSPLVTIMIPTYNQAAYIQEAIDSALSQKYVNLEIIVGDDASTDKTPEIIEKIHDSRLKYIRNSSNLGRVGNYKNLLYNHASGDFVVNLDGDDYYTDSYFIFNAIQLIQDDRNVVMVCARSTTKTSNSQYVSNIPDEAITNGVNLLKNLPSKKYFLMHMAVLYSRKEAIKIDFYRSQEISSDWESLYRLSLRGDVKYMDSNVGVWRIHGENETGTTDKEKKIGNLSIWPAIYADAKMSGMNFFVAEYKSARCIAYFAQSIFVKESLINNQALLNSIIKIFSIYKLSGFITFLNPIYIIRLILCLFGYYRCRNFR